MTLYYAASTGGFYSTAINGASIPTDAIEVTEAQRLAALSKGGDDTLQVIDGVLTIVGPTTAQIKSALQAYANAKALAQMANLETYAGGTTTLKSSATAATLADWAALLQWAAANPDATTQWIGDDSSVTALPASAVSVIANAVTAHSQAIYGALATVLTGIAGGSVTANSQIDAVAWPVAS